MSTRDKILTLFRTQKDSYLSGQEISVQLGISRAAVWKQVKSLQELGFTIEAKHSQGYRLLNAPDLLLATDIERGLGTQVVGRKIISVQEIDSTNSRIRELAEQGALEGTVLVADRQSAGRGRLGRRWESPAGVNIYCSILLRPQIPVQQAPQLTFLSAVAAAETLNQMCHLSAYVKWPNDILVKGAKISGLLNEMNAETDQIHFVILGIGINLNMTAGQFPDELNYPATSTLLETGAAVDRLCFLQSFLRKLDHYYLEFKDQGFAPVRSRWEGLCHIMNQRVVVQQQLHEIEGVVVGIDSDGALRLQHDDGLVERILAGDVKPLS